MDLTPMTMVVGAGVAFLLLTWLAIFDIASKEFSSQAVKIGWGIAVALVPFIGCFAYFLFGFRKGVRRGKPEAAEK